MPNYQLGKIYKIESYQTDKIYIGSTCEKYLSNRLAGHKSKYRKYLEEKDNYVSSYEILKYNDVFITLIEAYPCNSKYELHAREGYYIKQFECVNKNIAGRDISQYKNDNKEIIKERNKQYRDDNKEIIKKRNKQYRDDNKDKKKQYYEDNKDKIKQYYEDNKEIIKDKKKQYYDDNKHKIKQMRSAKIICECGAEICKGVLSKHRITIKHQQYENEIESRLLFLKQFENYQ